MYWNFMLTDTGQIPPKKFASWNSESMYATCASDRVLLKAKDSTPFPHRSIVFQGFLVTNTYLSIFLASMLTVLKGLGWVSSFKNYGSRKHFNSTGSTVSVKSSLDDLSPLHNPNRCVYCFTASPTYLFFLPATKRSTVLLITAETAD